tara:strand:+ start:7797 stop:8462 length:666 start_codon:yes stop_codon:yes gene_type:complete
MHKSITNLIEIEKKIYSKNLDKKNKVKIIAVSKTFNLDIIMPLIKHGHLDFGENKVQEAVEKWTNIKSDFKNISLHMIGKLQTNKVKQAVNLFDYIHSLDNIKLAKKISSAQSTLNKKIKLFIQINIGEEDQKSGIKINELDKFYEVCTKELNLNIIGLMCLPPINSDSKEYFKKMNSAAENLSLKELSMGMSSDYMDAVKYNASYVRIGSKIFGERTKKF